MLSFKRQEKKKTKGSTQTAYAKHPDYLVGPATIRSVEGGLLDKASLIQHDFLMLE